MGVTNGSPYVAVYQLSATPGNFFAIFYCCFIFKVNENFPKIFVELTFGLSDILESSMFSCSHIIHFIVITYGMKYALRKFTR